MAAAGGRSGGDACRPQWTARTSSASGCRAPRVRRLPPPPPLLLLLPTPLQHLLLALTSSPHDSSSLSKRCRSA